MGEHFVAAVRKSGQPPVRFHDLRHTSATLRLAAGVPLKVVQEELGHSSMSFTGDVYATVVDELKDRSAESLAASIPRRARTESDSGAR